MIAWFMEIFWYLICLARYKLFYTNNIKKRNKYKRQMQRAAKRVNQF